MGKANAVLRERRRYVTMAVISWIYSERTHCIKMHHPSLVKLLQL